MSTSTYDELPYLGFPRRHAHPGVIAANARIFGIETADVETARILELGCGDGGNILSIASTLPKAKCCGIDFSSIQIDKGRSAAAAAGLKNIDLIQSDFTTAEFPDDEYDYIIAHGVYSWISSTEQHRMLEVVRSLLSENGVAFISYNCFPGWNLRKLTREMMLYETRKLKSPQDKVNLAREVIPLVMQSVPANLKGYASLLQGEQSLVNSTGDYYIAHEHLEEDNQPCYFHEFAERLDDHDLQFVCEAELSSMYLNRYPAALDRLQQEDAGSNEARIESEQLLDFAVFRMFRQSLICSKRHDINTELGTDVVRNLYSSAFGDFQSQPEFTEQPETYHSAKGIGLTTSSPAAKAALYVLAKNWPNRLLFDELVEATLELVPGDRDVVEESIAEVLLAAATTDGVELHAERGNFTTEISEKPVINPLARFQAETDESVFTLRHINYTVDPFSRILLCSFDGSRSVEDVVPLIVAAVEDGSLTIAEGMAFPEDEAERDAMITDQIRNGLKNIADMGLLLKEAP
ncbi:MAG: class I SAM-dependent methyltransferase [Verrucomicrobiales bacterium]|nr:class I SAM-dependent methyltransferase [Verrucomicrobiales bacterium]